MFEAVPSAGCMTYMGPSGNSLAKQWTWLVRLAVTGTGG